jgi:gamma-glutamyltranspeptidase / glutathione hydrolase
MPAAPAATAAAARPTAAGPTFPVTNRPDVMGLEAAVSSDHPLASAAGIEVLRRGGNAVDAAVTMAGVLAVVRPHMNGVGGDAFALILDASTGRVSALNGSGRSGALATPEFFRAAGQTSVPGRGALSVSIPGAVGAWEEALQRHGTLTLAQALAPAIRYAEDGFPVSQRLHDDIAGASRALNDAARALYLPGGAPPAVGTLLKNPALAATLRILAAEGAAAMYGGSVGLRLAAYVESEGGHLRPDDFAAHTTDWETPLEVDYLGYRMLAMPPSTQGVTLLQQMRLADALGGLRDLGHNTPDYLHRMVEIMRLAFADRDRWVADPTFSEVPVRRMLDPGYARERAATIVPGRTPQRVESGIAGPSTSQGASGQDDGDTVYLTVVDAEGNAVSWIQSLFASFGSGLLEPETGIVLHNRGALYVMDEGHPQVVAPRKRPFHTLTPHMALHGDGRLAFTFGTPGGDSQTQTLLQIVHNMEFFGMSPQAAIEAPRYRSDNGRLVQLEDRIAPGVRDALGAMGYQIRPVGGWTANFGGAQLIRIHPQSGARIVAADPRREAYAVAY